MSLFPVVLLSLSVIILQQQQFTEAATLSLVSIPQLENGEVGDCPVQEKRDEVIQNITTDIMDIIRDMYAPLIHNCGEGEWYRVAYLNMSDPTQQCPSAWREYNNSGVRACGRPVSSSGSCPGRSYTTGRQYSNVCGRAVGYQIGFDEAFYHASESIDSYYVYGVSFTHGTPRNHIWTLAAGLSESGSNYRVSYDCPCADPSNPGNAVVPSYISDNYYCESGNPTSSTAHTFYSSDPLWDGEQCEGECCSNGKSPPWFSVQLPNPTTDDIEVRICGYHRTANGDVAVQELDIYIQ